MAAGELPFLTVADAKERAKSMRSGVPRREPVVITCLDAPGLFFGERRDLTYYVTHEIDWRPNDLPAQRNTAKWNEAREIKWLCNEIAEKVQLALPRFKEAIKGGG